MREALARVLWRVCGALDSIPYRDRDDHHWYRRGAWGCHTLHLSHLALRVEGGGRGR